MASPSRRRRPSCFSLIPSAKKTLAGIDRHKRMPSAVSTLMTTLAMQRMDGIPVQYVIGEWDFRQLTLSMKSPVFIPRPETEQLVDLVKKDLKERLSCASTSFDSTSTSVDSTSVDSTSVDSTSHSLGPSSPSFDPTSHSLDPTLPSFDPTSPSFDLTSPSASSPLHVLEVGCGSGAISLSLLHEMDQSEASTIDQSEASTIDQSPARTQTDQSETSTIGQSQAWTMTAIDISQSAIDLTAQNAAKVGVDMDRLTLRRMAINDLEKAPLPHRFSLLVSNPPYLPSSWASTLQKEVVDHEDHGALFSGADGCDAIRQILKFCSNSGLMTLGAGVWLEIEPSQERIIGDILEEEGGLELKQFVRDFRGQIRFVEIRTC